MAVTFFGHNFWS